MTPEALEAVGSRAGRVSGEVAGGSRRVGRPGPVAIQLEPRVDRAHGPFCVGRSDHTRHPDRGRGDHLDVDAARRRGPGTCRRRPPDGLFMPAPTRVTLAMPSSATKPAAPTSFTSRSSTSRQPGQVRLRHRERDIGRSVVGDVLHDHVDVHALPPPPTRRSAPRCPGGRARPASVIFASESSEATPEIDRLFHARVLLGDPRPGSGVERGSDVDLHAVVPSVLH